MKAQNKLKIWNEAEWDLRAQEAAERHPLKTLKTLPNMPGMTPGTAKHLRWKSLKWMIAQDHDRKILKSVLKKPFYYLWRYLKSIFHTKSFKREGDFFLYGVNSVEEFEELLQDKESLFVLGFSYCHKPFECPSGRFTDRCVRDLTSPICQQCFIGKALHACPEKNMIPLIIPTIHYIGGKIFDSVQAYPGKRILFMITACELTLTMFGDWGNMVDIRGIGVRLDGRICNTMRAFELSEKGIKPGLTVVLDTTQQTMLKLIRKRS